MQAGSNTNNSFRKLLEYNQRSLDFEKTGPAEKEEATNWSGVIFRVGEYRLICGIQDINEILDIPEMTPIPLSKPWIMGLANVRGNLVSVCDFMWFLSGIRSPISARSRLLMTDIQGHPVAFLVDEILGQRHLNRESAKPAKAFKDSPLSGCINQIFSLGDDSWGELELKALLTNPEFMTGSTIQ